MNCSKCDKAHYAKGLCKNHYSRKLWKENESYRKRSQEHNRGNWAKNKDKYHLTQANFYHNVIKEDPELLEKKRKQAREWVSDHRKQLNVYKRKWRKLNPEKPNGPHFNERIRKRDKECQICGSTKNLKAHHILNRKHYPKMAKIPNNGITLCHKCHLEVHGFKLINNPLKI